MVLLKNNNCDKRRIVFEKSKIVLNLYHEHWKSKHPILDSELIFIWIFIIKFSTIAIQKGKSHFERDDFFLLTFISIWNSNDLQIAMKMESIFPYKLIYL